MLFALGAVSSALDALQSLTSQKSSSAQQTGFGPATNPFAIDSSAGSTSARTTSSVNFGNAPQISPETMSALIAAQGDSATSSTTSSAPTSPQDALKDLFSQIDADGDGKITKSEFEDALGAGGTNLAQADDVFSKLDTDGDGVVSLDEMSKALKGAGHHRHAQGSGDAGGDSNSSAQASSGSTTTTVTNADGSTTTTVKYADGFKMSTTVPGASSASKSPYDWFGQMMQREAQTVSASATSSLSMSV